MNLVQLQLVFNHDNIDFVTKGLNEFSAQILKDHNATEIFGYFGRSFDSIVNVNFLFSPFYPNAVIGVLKSYLDSSPELVEVFMLWDLSNRDDNKSVCSAHTLVFSVIIYCTIESDNSIGRYIVFKLMDEYLGRITEQLSSGDYTLIHCTLGLILNMCRVSLLTCNNVYQKIIIPCKSFAAQLQPGKLISVPFGDQSKIQTDSRYMIIILLFTLLDSQDPSILVDFFDMNSLYRKALNGIYKDTSQTSMLILRGLLRLMSPSSSLSIQNKLNLVDNNFLKKSLDLYSNEDEEVKSTAHELIVQFAQCISQGIQWNSKGKMAIQKVSRGKAISLIRLLQPQLDIKHRLIQLELLFVQPSLLSHCVSTLSMPSWDPKPSFPYLSTLSHLIHVIQSTGIDTSKQTLREAIVSGEKKEKDAEVKHTADTLIGDMIPSGLTKKEFSKILLHPNQMLQRLGLILMRSILSRIHQTIHGNKREGDVSLSMTKLPRFTAYLHTALSTVIPDYQLLISLRGRYMKILSESSVNASSSSSSNKDSDNKIPSSNKDKSGDTKAKSGDTKAKSGDTKAKSGDTKAKSGDTKAVEMSDSLVLQIEGQVEGDGDTGTGTVDAGKTTIAMVSYLLSLLLSVLSEFIHTAPEIVAQSNFDPLKLIDDIVQWKATDSAEVAVADLEQFPEQLLLDSLKVLSVATSSRKVDQLCRWFGAKESAVKIVQHLFLSSSDGQWRLYKRSPLCKLMLLYLGHESKAVKAAARCLLVDLLHRSDLFEAHGTVVVEMFAEIEALVAALRLSCSSASGSGRSNGSNTRSDTASSSNGGDVGATIFLAEVCLKVAFHWNTEICYLASTIFQNESTSKGYVYYGVKSRISYATDSSSNTESILSLPFSPVLLASLCLYERSLGFLLDDLPKHIRSIVSPTSPPPPLAGTEADTGTAPDDASSGLPDMSEKLLFRGELLLFIERVVISSVGGVRDRSEYMRCLGEVTVFLHQTPSSSDAKHQDEVKGKGSELISLLNNLRELFDEDGSSSSSGGGRKWIQDLMAVKKKTKNKTTALTSSVNGVSSLVTAAGSIPTYLTPHYNSNSNNNNSSSSNNVIPTTAGELLVHTQWDIMLDVYTRHVKAADVTVEAAFNILRFIATFARGSPSIDSRMDGWSGSLMQLMHVIQCLHRLLARVPASVSLAVDTEVHTLYETLVLLCVEELQDSSSSSSSSDGISTTTCRKQTQLAVMSSLNVNFVRLNFLREDGLGNCLLKVVTAAITSCLHHRPTSQHTESMMPLLTLCKSLADCIKTSYPSLSPTLTTSPSFFLLVWALNETAPDHALKSIVMSQLIEDLTTGESSFNLDTSAETTASLGDLWSLESITTHLLLSSSASTLMKLLLPDGTDASSQRGDIKDNSSSSGASDKLNQLSSGYVLQTHSSSSSSSSSSTTKTVSATATERLGLSFLCSPLQRMINGVLASLQVASASTSSIAASGQLVAAAALSHHHILLAMTITNIISKMKVHELELFEIIDMFRPYLSHLCSRDSSSVSSLPPASDSPQRILTLPFDAISALQQQLYLQHRGLEDIRSLMESPMIKNDLQCYGYLMCYCLSTVNTPLFAVDFLPTLLTCSLPGLLLSGSRNCNSPQAMDVEVDVEDGADEGKIGCWLRVYQSAIWCLITSVTMLVTTSSSSRDRVSLTTTPAGGAATAAISSSASIYEQIKIDDDTIDAFCLAGGDVACDLTRRLNALARLFLLPAPAPSAPPVSTPSQRSKGSPHEAPRSPVISFESYLKSDSLVTSEVVGLKARCNLFVSILLEHAFAFAKKESLEAAAITDAIGDIMWSLVCPSELAVSNAISFALFSMATTDTCHPCKLLRTLLKYPGFSDTLHAQTPPVDNALQMAMLRLLVRIMSLMSCLVNIPLQGERGTSSSSGSSSPPRLTLSSVTSSDLSALVTHLMGIYSGTLSAKDRMIRRILELVYSTGSGPHYCTLLFTGGRDKGKDNNKDKDRGNEKPNNNLSRRGDRDGGGSGGGATRGASDNWIERITTAPMVYSSLKAFPFDRSALPPPLAEEGKVGCKNHMHAINMESNALRQGWGDSLYLDDHHSRVTRKQTEELPDSSEMAAVYDPSYWLPVAYHNIRDKEVSVRMIANSGLLSLMIASLGCTCMQMRTIALACLQRMFVLIRTQTSDVDASFKERPQLLLLLNFIRNSFDMKGVDADTDTEAEAVSGGKAEAGTLSAFIPSLAPSIAIFLARAALHLLQPAHELYGKINKYLLSRPFCDQKDVPLFDLLVTDGESSTESQERLAALRLIADGLLSREDHLNMCRKNAYNRLMLLYPVYNKDYRAGHAVLDVLDKAVQLKSASRYLLERCSVLTWLLQMCAFTAASASAATRVKKATRAAETGDTSLLDSAAVVAEDINDAMTDSDSITDEDNMGIFAKEMDNDKTDRKAMVSVSGPGPAIHPPRSLVRYLSLTRSCLSALCLLSAEGVDCGAFTDRVRHILATVAQDILATRTTAAALSGGGGGGSEVSDEMLKQLILGMWEYLMIATYSSCSSSSVSPGFASTLLLGLCEVVTSRRSSPDSHHLQLTLLLMLSFPASTTLRSGGLEVEASDGMRSVYTTVMDTTIRTFLLTSNLNHPAVPVARGRGATATATTKSPHDTYYALVDPFRGAYPLIDASARSQSQQQQQYSRSCGSTCHNSYQQHVSVSVSVFVSAVNIITGDVTVNANHLLEVDDVSSSGGGGGLEALFDEHWRQLKGFSVDTTTTTAAAAAGLFSSLDVSATLSALVKVLLNTTRSLSFPKTIPIATATAYKTTISEMLDMELVRWVLLIHQSIHRFPLASQGKSGNMLSRLRSRFLSIIDASPVDNYDERFCDFQLRLRLALLGCLSALVDPSLNMPSLLGMKRVLLLALSVLQTTNPSDSNQGGQEGLYDSHEEIVRRCFQILHGSTWRCDGHNLWESRNMQLIFLDLLECVFTMLSYVVTDIDCNSLNGGDGDGMETQGGGGGESRYIFPAPVVVGSGPETAAAPAGSSALDLMISCIEKHCEIISNDNTYQLNLSTSSISEMQHQESTTTAASRMLRADDICDWSVVESAAAHYSPHRNTSMDADIRENKLDYDMADDSQESLLGEAINNTVAMDGTSRSSQAGQGSKSNKRSLNKVNLQSSDKKKLRKLIPTEKKSNL